MTETMIRIGLTGGAGAGKSTCARLLAAQGCHVLDTDDLARSFTEPGHPCLKQITEAFGAGLLDAEGRLRRGALAQLVFADPDKLRTLESILHPPIRAAWQEALQDWDKAGASAGCVIIPLLYETAAETAFAVVIAVGCSSGTQRGRLLGRN